MLREVRTMFHDDEHEKEKWVTTVQRVVQLAFHLHIFAALPTYRDDWDEFQTMGYDMI